MSKSGGREFDHLFGSTQVMVVNPVKSKDWHLATWVKSHPSLLLMHIAS